MRKNGDEVFFEGGRRRNWGQKQTDGFWGAIWKRGRSHILSGGSFQIRVCLHIFHLTLTLASTCDRLPGKDKMLRIKEAADLLGISARMLRHYEAEKLVTPRRDENSYRHYTGADLAMAEWVRDLTASGFSMRELRKFSAALSERPPKPGPTCSEKMQEKIEQIDRLISSLNSRRNALSERLVALEAGRTDQQGASHENIVDSDEALPASGGL